VMSWALPIWSTDSTSLQSSFAIFGKSNKSKRLHHSKEKTDELHYLGFYNKICFNTTYY
jgi:hypothetical protein